MKNCSICKKIQPLRSFYKNSRSRDGLQQHCKTCHKVMTDRWDRNNIDRKRAVNRVSMAAYRKKHPEKTRELNRKYRELHGEEYKLAAREKNKRVRQEIISRYGGKCECCGLDDYRFLCFDHKDNDGYMHRKAVRAGWSLHRWIISSSYPKSIRVLCFNCNFARAFYGGVNKICPHQQLARNVAD